MPYLCGLWRFANAYLDNNNCEGKDLKWINKTFASLLDAFITDDSWGEPNNFDESERLEMLADPGAMIISYCKDGIEKLLTDNIFAPCRKIKYVIMLELFIRIKMMLRLILLLQK